MSTSDKWFEVWYDEGSNLLPAYLLIVTPDTSNPGLVQVYDPFEQRIIHSGQNYQNTRIWLAEDEYRLIDGRMFSDDSFPAESKSC